MWYCVNSKRASVPARGAAADDTRLNDSMNPLVRDENLNRNLRIVVGPAIGALIILGVLITGSIIPSMAQQPVPPGAKLKPFVETIPKSTVKMTMLPIPGGTVKIGTATVAVKPFYMARTETPWEMFDAFYTTGTPTPPYDQTDWPADAIAHCPSTGS